MMSRWLAGTLFMVGVVFVLPLATPAADPTDTQKHERQLLADAKQIDAGATRASSTPDGQRRVTERIAREFNVQPAVVTDLRGRLGGYGQATIALALSQELMKRDGLNQQDALNKITTLRQAGKGWGVIAHEQGLKLGQVMSGVKRAEKATEQVAGKPEKVAKAERPDKPEKPQKPEKPEKPSKPEKPGR
jgi:hypothetical protein